MRYTLLPLLLLLVGCNWFYMPEKKESKSKQESQSNRTVNTDIDLDYDPFVLPELDNRPPVEMDILGEKLIVPPNAKITGKFGSKHKQKDWFELVLTEKLTKKTLSLIAIGAFCIAAGAVLIFYGAGKIGIGAIIFGIMLLGCSFLIDNYAWVFGLVLLAVLIGVIYVAWQFIDKHQSELTLEKLVNRIEELKSVLPEEAKKHILDPLAKDRNATVIKSQVRKAKDA